MEIQTHFQNTALAIPDVIITQNEMLINCEKVEKSVTDWCWPAFCVVLKGL